MKYIYGIIQEPVEKIWSAQAAERWGVEIVREGQVGAVVREVADKTLKAGRDELFHHEEVIELVMLYQTILPARFGTVLPEPGAVAEILKKYACRYQELFKELAGKVEMGFRVIWQSQESNTPSRGEPAPKGPVSGRDYLLAKYRQYQLSQGVEEELQGILREVHESVRPLAVNWKLSQQSSPILMFSGVYLIAKDQVEAFRERCRSLPQRHPEVKFLCSGPWPPYNFSLV